MGTFRVFGRKTISECLQEALREFVMPVRRVFKRERMDARTKVVRAYVTCHRLWLDPALQDSINFRESFIGSRTLEGK